ncbi:MAG: thiolase family protein [Minisyncoccales bacterium]
MFVKGVGMTKFDYSQKPWWQFAFEAGLEALEDGRLSIKDIDAIVFTSISSCTDPKQEHQTHKTSLLSELFKTHCPIIETPSVCAGGGVAIWTACHLKGFKNILVLSGERVVNSSSEDTTDKILSAAERIFEQGEGMLFPVQNALLWQQYEKRFGATTDDLALIAFKNHQNATLNPKAYYYKRPVSLQEIKNSPLVAWPLRMLDCALSVNGGAAIVLSQEKTDIEIIASAFATDYLLSFNRQEYWHFPASKKAAQMAYQQSKIKPEDIQVAEVHDAFTSVELFSYEDLFFAPEGKGAFLIREGIVNLDGKLPINPSGGLKAKGHPISVTGLAQFYEIVNQLRNRCQERQLKPVPKIGLCHNVGGTGGSATVHILRKIS